MAAAQAIVAARRRNLAADAAPWWVCMKCNHDNHPRAGYPNDKCEQCGRDRDLETDPTYTPNRGN